MKNYFQQLKGITIATVFFFGLLYVQAWTGAPAGTPPDNNVDAPVNVGDSTQYKSGSLGVGGLLKAYSTFNIPTGAGLGKVLISDATGNASWTSTSSLGISGGITSITGGSCSVGQVVKSISSSGVVTCVTDAGGITSESDPTVTASVKDGVSWGEVTGKPTIGGVCTGSRGKVGILVNITSGGWPQSSTCCLSIEYVGTSESTYAPTPFCD